MQTRGDTKPFDPNEAEAARTRAIEEWQIKRKSVVSSAKAVIARALAIFNEFSAEDRFGLLAPCKELGIAPRALLVFIAREYADYAASPSFQPISDDPLAAARKPNRSSASKQETEATE